MCHGPAARFQRVPTFVIVAILVAGFALPFSVVSVPGTAAQGGSLPEIDLTKTKGLVNQSQTHPMWGDLPVGPSGNLVMGRCGCLLSAFSTVVTHHLGPGAIAPSLSIPWFQVELNSLVINLEDDDIEHDSKTRKGPLELTSSFSPVYIDQYLQHGNLREIYPPNWGYKSGFIDVCGGQVHYDALENLANPVVVYDEQGNPVDSSPSGVRLQWYDGYGADVRSIIDRNLLAGNPTIVGLENPQNREAHAYVIVGWNPEAQKYLVVDPATPVYKGANFPEAAPPGSAGRTYEGWEQMIKGIIDVQPVHHLGHGPLVLRVYDEPAPFELPAPPSERMLSVREPRPGTYRFLATATGDGELILNFTTVDGPQLTEVGSVTQPITRGQTVKMEARSTGSAVESVIQVDNFTPEARAGNDVGGAVESEVTFDARRSFDLDGDIVSYTWDFDDGASGTGSEPAHAYEQPGIYTVTLTVTDNGGATATATTRAIVGQEPPAQTTLVSVSSTGAQGMHGGSSGPSISGDGRYVAFHSAALRLVPGDTNAVSDVFVRDHQTGVTTRVSVSSSGAQANGPTFRPAISDNGRFIAFESNASNLVPGDTNGRSDIFVHDRETGTTERVSISSTGLQANNSSYEPAISGDGRFVAFQSIASNLVEGDTNAAMDVFVHDRQADTTERVSLTSDGSEAPPDSDATNALPNSHDAAISADGRFITFQSGARLVPDDTNSREDIYLRDRQAGTTDWISLPGDRGDIGGWLPAISGDGNIIAFVDGDFSSVVVYDRRNGETEEVGPDGRPQSPNPGDSIAISHNGRFVAFAAQGNVLPGDLYIESTHVYLRDRQSGTLERVSISDTGEVETYRLAYFVSPVISNDGRFIAFGQGTAVQGYRDTALVPDDSNNQFDVFLRDRQEPEPVQPVAILDGPYLGWATSDAESRGISFTAENSLGFNGLPLQARWDFGDGSPPVTRDYLYAGHSYSAPGTYTVTLTVYDDLAESEPVTTTVEVLPPLPPERLSVSPSCTEAGGLLSISGYGDEGSLFDLDEGPETDPRKVGWNFADGPLSVEPVEISLP